MSTTRIPASGVATPETDYERRQQMARNRAAIAVLQSWVDVDEREAAEQRETLAFLMEALNEDRLSDRDRF
jgi:hypothetical protein